MENLNLTGSYTRVFTVPIFDRSWSIIDLSPNFYLTTVLILSLYFLYMIFFCIGLPCFFVYKQSSSRFS